jgi:hypothetical protein
MHSSGRHDDAGIHEYFYGQGEKDLAKAGILGDQLSMNRQDSINSCRESDV